MDKWQVRLEVFKMIQTRFNSKEKPKCDLNRVWMELNVIRSIDSNEGPNHTMWVRFKVKEFGSNGGCDLILSEYFESKWKM